MSTIGYDSWAVDLAEVGAVYPFQGMEVPMVIVGVAFWIGWHMMQMKVEREELDATEHDEDKDQISANLERY